MYPFVSVGGLLAGTRYYYRVTSGSIAYPFAGQVGQAFFDTAPSVAADFDRDTDVDLSDFAHFQACFNGPNRALPMSGCGPTDLDPANDCDLSDFARFQSCFNGPNRPAACT